MSKKLKVVLGVVLAVVLVGAVVFGVVAWKNKQRAEEMAPVSVSFVVDAEGWSQETSSPVPIQVTGETEDKEKVDEKYFLDASDKSLSLKPGSYDVEVYASPVNANGGMYRCPKAVKVSVPKNNNASKSKTNTSVASEPVLIHLSPVPANEITDEDIEKAQAAMKDAGLDEAEITTFTDSARKARQTELDRIESERVAKEREAQGMYPGAGGSRPAGAQSMPEGYSNISTNYADCSVVKEPDGRETGEVYCYMFDWEKTKPAGEDYSEGVPEYGISSGTYPVTAVLFNSDGSPSPKATFPMGLGMGLVPKVGEAYYYGDHVFGITGSGITYWNSRTGKGAFMSPNAYIPF